jgi:putative tryptophan/tyrosine transport system substrate-binding protein
MNRRRACRALFLLPVAAATIGSAQSTRPYRIAWVTTERKDVPSPNFTAFREGLRALGLSEGRDVTIHVWSGDGAEQRIEAMTPDIVRSQPDVVVAAGGLALFAMLKSNPAVPIVFSISADPVEAKIAQSFAHPGGNLTGISLFTLALVGKRLELVKEVLPQAKRVALIANPQHPGEKKELAAAQEAAAKLGVSVRYFPVTSEAEVDAALADIARTRDDAIVAFADGFTMGFAPRIAQFSMKERIPAVDGWAPFVRAGNLMIYGPVVDDVYRRLAGYVDKIRKGAKPADLPIELPNKVELVVNARTASALGIAIPQSVLSRADEVIR